MKGDLEIKLISNSKTAGQSPKRPRKWTSRYVILELGVITIYNSYFDNDSNDIITSFEVKDINHIIRDHLFFYVIH